MMNEKEERLVKIISGIALAGVAMTGVMFQLSLFMWDSPNLTMQFLFMFTLVYPIAIITTGIFILNKTFSKLLGGNNLMGEQPVENTEKTGESNPIDQLETMMEGIDLEKTVDIDEENGEQKK